MSKTDQPDLWWDGPPAARTTDPTTSHQAAAAVKPANAELVDEIRRVVGSAPDAPMTADWIVYLVGGNWGTRWARGTIVSAISRANLTVVDENGRSDRGRVVRRYSL